MKKIICMFILLFSFVLFACGENQTLTFENTNLNLKVGEIVELSPVVTNAENEKVNYVSLNEDVIKIKDSKIIALTTGSTTVIASLEENKEVFVNISVKVDFAQSEAIDINGPTSLKIGESAKYTLESLNEDAIVKWSVSNDYLASIDQEGNLTTKLPGDVKVKVTVLDGSFKEGEITVSIKEEKIIVGATSYPHAEILNCEAIKNYIKSKGYSLEVKEYYDFQTPNKDLSNGTIDANYFQHIPYLNTEIEIKGYDLSVACEVHNEPLNLYGKVAKDDWSNTRIYVTDDKLYAERSLALLKANELIDSYDIEDLTYTSSKNVEIVYISSNELTKKVEEGEYAIINNVYVLINWSPEKAISYKQFGESTHVAYPNVVVCKTEDLNNIKIKILVEALAQKEVQEFITNKYGPTVEYLFKSNLTE